MLIKMVLFVFVCVEVDALSGWRAHMPVIVVCLFCVSALVDGGRDSGSMAQTTLVIYVHVSVIMSVMLIYLFFYFFYGIHLESRQKCITIFSMVEAM